MKFEEVTQNFVPTAFFGFNFSGGFIPTLIRIISFAILTGIHAVIKPNSWSQKEYLIFAGSIAFVILIITATLTILTRIFDNSFELSTDTEESVSDIDIPPGISDALWKLRSSYPFDEQRASESAFELIQAGFSADEVFSLIEYMNSHQEEPKQLQKKRKRENTSYIRFFGTIKKFPFTRKQLSIVFPFPKTFTYIFFVTILAFFQLYLVSFTSHHIPKGVYWWYCIISGGSIYSILQPPQDEPYSLTHEESTNGMTRPFFLIIACGFILLFEYLPTWFEPIELDIFHITINWEVIKVHAIQIWKFGIYCLPIWLFFFIPPIGSTITWFIESVNRYLFGSCGVAGLIDSFAQLIRCFVVYIICYFIHSRATFKYHDEVAIITSHVILNIPISPISHHKILYYIFQQIILTGVVTIASIYCSTRNGYFYSIIIIPVVLNLVIPFLVTFTQYFIFVFRFIRIRIQYIEFFFIIIRAFFGVSFIKFCILSETVPTWLFGFFVCIVLNTSVGSTSVYAFSLLVFCHFYYELNFSNICGSFMVSYWVGRKLLHGYDITREYILGRLSLMSDFNIEDVQEFINIIYYIVVLCFPFVDRSFSFKTYLWSIISGAPKLLISQVPLFHTVSLPSAPRPNIFWDLAPPRNLDVMKTIASHATEHPLEAPVYLSAVRDLVKVLARQIYSGNFGAVDENDIFLMVNNKMSLLLHIISLRPNCVQFQVRGLEYNDATTCHQMEIRALEDISVRANEWQISAGFLHLRSNWSYVNCNIPLDMYEVSATELSTILNTSNRHTVLTWMRLCLIFYALKEIELLVQVPQGEDPTNISNEQEIDYISGNLGIEMTHDLKQQLQLLINDCLEILTKSNGVESNAAIATKVFASFHGNLTVDEDNYWLTNNQRMFEDVITPAMRLFILSLVLMQFGYVDEPDLLEDSSIFDHFMDFEESYLVSPAGSNEFAHEFTMSKKQLLTVESCLNTKTVLLFKHSTAMWNVYRLNKSSVRSLWSSQAFEQVFMRSMDKERFSIQFNTIQLHNIINQACNLPIGYPAYVSPVLSSYYTFRA